MAWRMVATRACVVFITDDAVACGALLISICPPGSKEIRAPSSSFHDGGSLSAECSSQPSRFPSRERTSAVVGPSFPLGRAGSRVDAWTGMSSISTPITRGVLELVGEKKRCRRSASSFASERLTGLAQLSARASARAKEPSSAGIHFSIESPDAERISSSVARSYL